MNQLLHTPATGGGSARRLVSTVLVSAVAAGVALDVLTFLVARYGPQGGTGDSWSLRGNGALLVPFGVGPAVLAGAWSALVLHARGVPHWLRKGGLFGLMGAAFAGASVLVLIEFGSAGPGLSELLVVPTWLWVGAAPLLAAALSPVHRGPGAQQWPLYGLAAVLFPITLATAFLLAEGWLSPGS